MAEVDIPAPHAPVGIGCMKSETQFEELLRGCDSVAGVCRLLCALGLETAAAPVPGAALASYGVCEEIAELFVTTSQDSMRVWIGVLRDRCSTERIAQVYRRLRAHRALAPALFTILLADGGGVSLGGFWPDGGVGVFFSRRPPPRASQGGKRAAR